jgi:hypothetical protein
VDRFRIPPPPPPGRPPITGEDGTLVFIIEPDPTPPPSRPATPPAPPGAALRPLAPLAMRRDEVLGDAIARIGVGLLDRAAASLALTDRERAAADALTAVGQVRAMLRLVSPAIGERAFLFEDARMREARDAVHRPHDDAMLPAALEGLIERFGDRLQPGAFEAVLAGLVDRYRPAGDSAVARALEVVAAARARYSAFPTESIADSFASIDAGMRTTYSRGQLRMGEAYRHPTDRSFRRWLTQVGYLRDQATMLDPDWATLGLSERLRKLANALAEARTLTILAGAVEADRLGDDAEDRELIRMLVLGRCRDIYSQMLDVGSRLYADDPTEFTERFGAYWGAWRSR